ncbi:porin [Cupriavidus basilensis OR16]|uniref:Porin n=1 Tax=Cupriavidus basilensis OR16 TaxID=1127483 RepID=H1S7G6_9BURK|nr:porin [Cupriavidus basilensis]EHP41560.1 porin [Cupriavidus basilensis OR16]
MDSTSAQPNRQFRARTVRCGLTAFAALASGLAQAQIASISAAQAPGMTLYGLIDTGVEYVSNVGSRKDSVVRMPSLTGSLPSRWGLRGIENLGGGLNSIFVLESGFAPSQGTLNQGGRLFGRQAYVGLFGPWGVVTVGRLYSQIYWSLIGDTLAPNIFGAGLLDTYLTAARVDNAIDYTFMLSGFTFGATYSFGRDAVAPAVAGGCAGESPADWRACKSMSAMLKYEAASWGVATAIDRNYGGGGAGSALPQSAQTDTRGVINGYVKFGTSTVGGGFLHRNNQGSANPSSNYWWLGATYLPQPQIALDVQYGRLTVKGSSTGASVIAARAMYMLSKRSSVYITAGRMFNQRDASFTIDGGAIGTVSLPSAGVNQTGALIGIRHKF